MSSVQLVQKAYLVLSNGGHGKLGLLAAASVVSYAYSSLVLRLLEYVGVSLLASPQIAVAIVAVCLLPQLPQARACWQDLSRWNTGCSGSPAAAEDKHVCGRTPGQKGGRQPPCSRLRSFQLVQPSVTSSMPCGISSYTCTGGKGRRRLFPRLSVELTPLPRLSLEFQSSSSRKSSKQTLCSGYKGSYTGSDDLSRISVDGYAGSSCSGIGRWEPTMMRISSGQDLQLLDSSTSNAAASCLSSTYLEVDSSNTSALSPVGEALASADHGTLPADMQHLGEVITRTHLLQFGAMLGEASSRSALAAEEAGGPVNHPSSFYGSADTDEFQQPWHLIVSESSANVLYWAWRRPLRKGLYMYMSRTVFLQASPAELRAFMNDDAYRLVWDSSMQVLRHVECSTSNTGASRIVHSNAAAEAMAVAMAARTSGCSPSNGSDAAGVVKPAELSTNSSGCEHSEALDGVNSSCYVLPHESGIMQSMVQFPRPMASRSYVYARRVWHRPSDGGCYCLAKSCSYPGAPALPGKAVPVDDYVAGSVVRSPAKHLLPAGHTGHAAEMMLVYFEDSHVRPGLANMGVKKGLWPLVQRTEKALRVYQAGAAANVHLQPGASTPRLERSYSTPSPGSFNEDDKHVLSSVTSSVGSSSICGSEMDGDCPASVIAEVAAVSGVCSAASAEGVEHSMINTAGPVEEAASAAGSLHDCKADSAPDMETSSSRCDGSLQEVDGCCDKTPAAGNKKGRQYWSWWSSMTTAVGGALKESAQLIAAASIALWQSHTKLALLVPTLEWKLLHWVLQHVPAPKQLLLGIGGSAVAGTSSRKALVNSHPIGDMAHPSLICRLLQDTKVSSGPSLLRVASHPLQIDEAEVWPKHEEEVPTASSYHSYCCGRVAVHTCSTQEGHRHQHQEPLLGCDWPSAAYHAVHTLRDMDKHNRCCAHMATAAACDDSASQCGSVGGTVSTCSCARYVGSYPTSASGSDRCCSCCCGSSSSRRVNSCSGGCVRVSGGGRRQRRVAVRLMQAAGLRLAHKLISALEQSAAAAGRD